MKTITTQTDKAIKEVLHNLAAEVYKAGAADHSYGYEELDKYLPLIRVEFVRNGWIGPEEVEELKRRYKNN